MAPTEALSLHRLVVLYGTDRQAYSFNIIVGELQTYSVTYVSGGYWGGTGGRWASVDINKSGITSINERNAGNVSTGVTCSVYVR